MVFVLPRHLYFSDGAYIIYRADYGKCLILHRTLPNNDEYYMLQMIYASQAYLTIEHSFFGVRELSKNLYHPFTVANVMNAVNDFFQRPLSRTFKKRLGQERPDVCIKGKKKFWELLGESVDLYRMTRRGQYLQLEFGQSVDGSRNSAR